MAWDRTKQSDPQTYKEYCWFIYQQEVELADGEKVNHTMRVMFPPSSREDIYGGKTETEIRSLTFERLNELERKHGAVEIEMIKQ